MDSKVRISMTIDPKTLARIDRVCEAREEPRSAYVERVLRRSLGDEEAYLEEMESPLWRGIYKALASPRTLTVLANLIGDELSDVDKASIVANIAMDAERGRTRSAMKKRARKRTES